MDRSDKDMIMTRLYAMEHCYIVVKLAIQIYYTDDTYRYIFLYKVTIVGFHTYV